MSKVVDEYYRDHVCCPNCGSECIKLTGEGSINTSHGIHDSNMVSCNGDGCVWEGIVHDLVAKSGDDDPIKMMLCEVELDEGDKKFLRSEIEKLLIVEREKCAKVVEQTDIEGDYTGRFEDGGSFWESDAGLTLQEAVRRIRIGIEPKETTT